MSSPFCWLADWADLDARLGYRSLGGWGNSTAPDVLAAVSAMLARIERAIQQKPAGFKLVVSLPTLALPPGFFTTGRQASGMELALENAVSDFAVRVAAQPSVAILNRDSLASASAMAGRYDFRSDLNAGFPYSIQHADAIAEAVANLILPCSEEGFDQRSGRHDVARYRWRGGTGGRGVGSGRSCADSRFVPANAGCLS